MNVAFVAPRLMASKPSAPGAGKQVDRMSSIDLHPQQIEDGLANAVFHGPRPQIAAVFQLATAQRAANNPQARRLAPPPVRGLAISLRLGRLGIHEV